MGVTTIRDTRDIVPRSFEKSIHYYGLSLEEFSSLFTGDTSRTRDMSGVPGIKSSAQELRDVFGIGVRFCRLRTGMEKLGGSKLQSMTRDAASGGQTRL